MRVTACLLYVWQRRHRSGGELRVVPRGLLLPYSTKMLALGCAMLRCDILLVRARLRVRATYVVSIPFC